MWVARDKNGVLRFFSKKPNRIGVQWIVDDNVYGYSAILDSSLFPNLTWEDEPVEVTLFSVEYERLVESRRKFDYDKMNEYCKKQCDEYWDCRYECEGHCDFVKRLFEIN